jgi:hypothetical protein
MADFQADNRFQTSPKYTRDSRQSAMTMLHLNGSKEPNIKLSIDSNASIAANTIDPLKVFQFHHIQCQFEQATSHQIERHESSNIQATEHNGDASRQINQTHSCACTQI